MCSAQREVLVVISCALAFVGWEVHVAELFSLEKQPQMVFTHCIRLMSKMSLKLFVCSPKSRISSTILVGKSRKKITYYIFEFFGTLIIVPVPSRGEGL